ncbi:unnamed protein product [Brassica napus]|uniref:(rape) hypothetical protein n=1 Tax=Brassica napus TaxID=3708 RepID=A0A816QEG4_BRANA|nr:unnamed protein product [Brassica napus]
MRLSPAQFRLDYTHSFRISPNPGTKSVKEHSTKRPAFANPETVFVRKQCCNNPVNHRVFERKLRPKPSGRGHSGEASSATDRAQVPWKGRQRG